MKIKNIGSNMTELTIGNNTILFSYNTPVAARTHKGTFKTSKKWSVTTSKHINKWLNGLEAMECDQEYFDELVD